MVTESYANACTEVVRILDYIPYKDYKKIPRDVILHYEKNANNDYDFEYDVTQSLDEQNISKTAKTIIAIFYRDYWATPYQKEIIEAKEKYDLEQIEKEKYNKYNPDNLFKNKNTITMINDEIQQESTSMVQYKEKNFLQKIFDKIKHLFRK